MENFNMDKLPETGLIRLKQIVGDPNASPPIFPIIPISKSHWWEGVKSGRFPQPLKLGPRTTVWRVEDIRALIADPLKKNQEKSNAGKS